MFKFPELEFEDLTVEGFEDWRKEVIRQTRSLLNFTNIPRQRLLLGKDRPYKWLEFSFPSDVDLVYQANPNIQIPTVDEFDERFIDCLEKALNNIGLKKI